MQEYLSLQYTQWTLQANILHKGALDNTDFFLGHIFSPPKRICAYNTYQFSDYSKYMVEVFSEVEKAAYRDSHFFNDINKTFNLGKEIGKTLSLH